LIYVCNLFEMPHHARVLRAGYLVSLVQPEFQPPTPAGVSPERHHRVAVHDIAEPMGDSVVPGETHVRGLIAFLGDWPGSEPLLLHCYAGVSRSTAAALIALTLGAEGRETEAALALRAAAPHAQPNARIIALADQLLGRRGRLIAARSAMGPATLVVEAPLVALQPL
jgi:predicted protein tyrosine phosphatase